MVFKELENPALLSKFETKISVSFFINPDKKYLNFNNYIKLKRISRINISPNCVNHTSFFIQTTLAQWRC